MNILILSWRDLRHPLAGGAEQAMHEHMKGWISVGHKVTFFSSKVKGQSDRQTIDGVEIMRGGHQYLGVQIAALLYYLKNSEKIDLVVDEFHGIPFFTPLYTRKPKLAVIQEVAGKVWFLNSLATPLNWIVGMIGFIFEPFIFLFYGNVPFMTGSNSARDAIVKWGIPLKNITVVPHGVILLGSRILRPKPKTKTVTYLGLLSKDKGIEGALECFMLLAKRHDYDFWVVGKGETGEYEKKIKKMARPLGKRIKFWGFVPQKKKFELLAKSHLLINPSVHEGWGLVNIEANAVGVPVVAYRSAGLVDSVKNGVSGVLTLHSTPEDLAAEVEKILEDENLYKKLSDGAVGWASTFSWEKSRKISLNLVESVGKIK